MKERTDAIVEMEEKQSGQQAVNARYKEITIKDVLVNIGLGLIYLGVIVMLIVLPLKEIPNVPIDLVEDEGQNVQNTNNWLPDTCPLYTDVANAVNRPLSSGPLELPYQRPSTDCRTFTSSAVETLIANMTSRMIDPDLARLFENAYPNTLDTTVSWFSLDESDPLAYVITGDIPAQWLRDSSHQFVPYLPLLSYDANLTTLFRGLINLEASRISDKPYCNAFQPPDESGLPAQSVGSTPQITPSIDSSVYQCKWEIDSLASFLRLSWGYWEATYGDTQMISSTWLNAIQQIMNVLVEQSLPTMAADGSINTQNYIYLPTGSRATDELLLNGYGSPSVDVGLVRSAFRPSDDSTIFQLFIPANAMLSVNLHRLSIILNATNNLPALSAQAEIMSETIRQAILQNGIINSPNGTIYAYEVDGMGGVNFMDDANIPSLMSLPYLGFVNSSDEIYQNTRNTILSTKNPYYFFSTSTNYTGIGGPHRGLNRIWPMNWIVQLSTSTSVDERITLLNWLKETTAGLGLIHENFDVGVGDGSGFGRLWFGWGNSLFGEVLLNMALQEGELGAEILFGEGQPALDLGAVFS